jgi:hypothetical protein
VTLCVAVTTADGLVMGADSMTVVRDALMAKTYANAEKVFQLTPLPIVVMTYGVGALGRRSIASLVNQWNRNRLPYEKEGYTVEQVARDLGTFVFEQHREHRELVQRRAEQTQTSALRGEGGDAAPIEFNPLEWTTGLVVGGYQPASVYPWLWTWEEPARPGVPDGLQLARPHEGELGEHGPEPGLDYWGDKRSLDRLVDGRDPALVVDLLDGGYLQPRTGLEEALSGQRWKILYEGMPVKDAADLARFALQVGSGWERFGHGEPSIGGELDIAVITREVVHWYDRKPLSKALSARFIPDYGLQDPKE